MCVNVRNILALTLKESGENHVLSHTLLFEKGHHAREQ